MEQYHILFIVVFLIIIFFIMYVNNEKFGFGDIIGGVKSAANTVANVGQNAVCAVGDVACRNKKAAAEKDAKKCEKASQWCTDLYVKNNKNFKFDPKKNKWAPFCNGKKSSWAAGCVPTDCSGPRQCQLETDVEFSGFSKETITAKKDTDKSCGYTCYGKFNYDDEADEDLKSCVARPGNKAGRDAKWCQANCPNSCVQDLALRDKWFRGPFADLQKTAQKKSEIEKHLAENEKKYGGGGGGGKKKPAPKSPPPKKPASPPPKPATKIAPKSTKMSPAPLKIAPVSSSPVRSGTKRSSSSPFMSTQSSPFMDTDSSEMSPQRSSPFMDTESSEMSTQRSSPFMDTQSSEMSPQRSSPFMDTQRSSSSPFMDTGSSAMGPQSSAMAPMFMGLQSSGATQSSDMGMTPQPSMYSRPSQPSAPIRVQNQCPSTTIVIQQPEPFYDYEDRGSFWSTPNYRYYYKYEEPSFIPIK